MTGSEEILQKTKQKPKVEEKLSGLYKVVKERLRKTRKEPFRG